jgi:hypothetical protein
MEYILTQEDIDNYNLAGAVKGQVALPEELKVMGMSPEPADPTAGGDPIYTAARNAGFDVDEAVMRQNPATRAGPSINPDPSIYTQNVSMPSSVSSMGGAGGASSSMLDLLSTPVPQDPMEGLSRNQRMLLGFAAMKDAGMALMGKDSSAVAGVMGDFTERANMERKRKAALSAAQAERARQARIDALLGGISPSVAAGPTGVAAEAGEPADIDAVIRAHDAQMGTFAQLDQMDAWTAKREALISQRDRQDKLTEDAGERVEEEAKAAKVTQASIQRAKGTLDVARRALGAATGLDPEDLEEVLKSGDIDGKKFILSRFAGIESKGYKDYMAAVNELAAVMTFENLASVIEAGAQLGTISDADLKVLGNMTGALDVENMPEQTAETIFRLYGKITKTLEALEGGQGAAESGILSDLKKKYPKVGSGG